MGIHHLKSTQFLPISLEEAWDFFSSPENLQAITPDYLGFEIVNKSGNRMYSGQIIQYKVHPILNIPLNWVTEITHVEQHHFFVDEQRFGPYAFWHHQHVFEEKDGGVEMTDILTYKLPFGILGEFAHWLFVKKQLSGIFQYRFDVLKRRFDRA